MKIHRITNEASTWTWCDLEYGKHYPAQATTDLKAVTCLRCRKKSGPNWRHQLGEQRRLRTSAHSWEPDWNRDNSAVGTDQEACGHTMGALTCGLPKNQHGASAADRG